MLVEIFFLVLVLAVALLMAVDLARTPSESPHGQADGQAQDADRATAAAPGGTGAEAFRREPARTGVIASAHDAGPPPRPDPINSSPGGHRRPGTWSAAHYRGSRRSLKNWRFRSRLFVVMIIPAIAATVVTLSVVRIVSQSTSTHSQGSSALVASAVGIIVVALALWSTITVFRSALRPLQRLRAEALEVVGARLPDAIRVIDKSGGEGVPPPVEPIDVGSTDEIAEVAHAFDQLHREVLRLAVSVAALRGKRNAMFMNLSLRGESVAERQLRLIDDLEQGEQDAGRLRNLFKLDHLAILMRRHSQNLRVLAGHEISGQENRSMVLVNVIKTAASGIEEYERVSLNAQPGIAVSGPAVIDVVHLLAELAENATSLSPADTPVIISGRRLATGGVLVDIIDRGFGMSAQEMAQANWRLEHPQLADTTAYKHMGLFVVGRLAARHGIRVRLLPSEFGGLTALVWLPDAVMMYQDAAAPSGLSGFGSAGSRPGSLQAATPGSASRVDPDHAATE